MKATTNFPLVAFFLVLAGTVSLLSGTTTQAQQSSLQHPAAGGNPGRSSSQNVYDGPGGVWPSWMVEPQEQIHGIGVSPFRKTDSLKSYSIARELALQDLNASDSLIVTIQMATDPRFPSLRDKEFAIGDRITSENVVTVDSMVIGNRVFYLVSDLPMFVDKKTLQTIPAERPHWVSSDGVEQEDEFLYAVGKRKILEFNKQRVWAEAKQDALSKLATHASLSIKTNQKTSQYYSSETTYIRAQISLRELVVHSRWTDGSFYYVRVRVPASKVRQFN